MQGFRKTRLRIIVVFIILLYYFLFRFIAPRGEPFMCCEMAHIVLALVLALIPWLLALTIALELLPHSFADGRWQPTPSSVHLRVMPPLEDEFRLFLIGAGIAAVLEAVHHAGCWLFG